MESLKPTQDLSVSLLASCQTCTGLVNDNIPQSCFSASQGPKKKKDCDCKCPIRGKAPDPPMSIPFKAQ